MAAASSNGQTIEVIKSQRQGNWVSCSGLIRFQSGMDKGVAMKIVNASTAASALIAFPFSVWFRDDRQYNATAGQNIATVISKRMFIHHTLRESVEKLERIKF